MIKYSALSYLLEVDIRTKLVYEAAALRPKANFSSVLGGLERYLTG